MSVLVVGLSHNSASMPILERVAVTGDVQRKLLRDIFHAADVAGTFVVSTCNRVEVYAEVARFHGALAGICELLSRYSGVPAHELTPHLYVHYEDRAVQHLFTVTCGLDSMVVGEGQILGQVRTSLRLARETGTLGRVLGDLGAAAMRTGKRAHTETGIDRMGASMVSAGVALAAARFAGDPDLPLAAAAPVEPVPLTTWSANRDAQVDVALRADTAPLVDALPDDPTLRGRDVLIVGAGSMSALAATTVARAGAGSIVVANRTRRRAEKVATAVGGRAVDLTGLPAQLAVADLVISCTGATDLIITAGDVAAATSQGSRPLVLLDLAMPHDVDRDAGSLPGVSIIDIEELSGVGGRTAGQPAARDDVAAVRDIVEAEFVAYRGATHAARVTPTVVALRAKAAEVVDVELARLAGRLHGVEGLDSRALDEIGRTVRRVVDKLLHAPTVRVKELAGSPDGDAYDTALRVLFDLDPRTVDAVARAAGERSEKGEPC